MPKISYIHALFWYKKRWKLWFSRWHIPASVTSMKSKGRASSECYFKLPDSQTFAGPANWLGKTKMPLFSNTQREWTDRSVEAGISWWIDDFIMQKDLYINISTTEQFEAELCASESAQHCEFARSSGKINALYSALNSIPLFMKMRWK